MEEMVVKVVLVGMVIRNKCLDRLRGFEKSICSDEEIKREK